MVFVKKLAHNVVIGIKLTGNAQHVIKAIN
jgi:hypothetical protein